jgi:hypothetical protein
MQTAAAIASPTVVPSIPTPSDFDTCWFPYHCVPIVFVADDKTTPLDFIAPGLPGLLTKVLSFCLQANAVTCTQHMRAQRHFSIDKHFLRLEGSPACFT